MKSRESPTTERHKQKKKRYIYLYKDKDKNKNSRLFDEYDKQAILRELTRKKKNEVTACHVEVSREQKGRR